MFDQKQFARTKFTARTEDVPVPDLSQFFTGEDDAPVWTVRGLSGVEYGQMKVAAEANKNTAAIITALSASSTKEKIEGIQLALGVGEVPDNVAERLAMLRLASVAPTCSEDLALLLCERFPVEFYNITNVILKLTGKGMVPGKLPSSSQTPA